VWQAKEKLRQEEVGYQREGIADGAHGQQAKPKRQDGYRQHSESAPDKEAPEIGLPSLGDVAKDESAEYEEEVDRQLVTPSGIQP
jgi:hypothetical protein